MFKGLPLGVCMGKPVVGVLWDPDQRAHDLLVTPKDRALKQKRQPMSGSHFKQSLLWWEESAQNIWCFVITSFLKITMTPWRHAAKFLDVSRFLYVFVAFQSRLKQLSQQKTGKSWCAQENSCGEARECGELGSTHVQPGPSGRA